MRNGYTGKILFVTVTVLVMISLVAGCGQSMPADQPSLTTTSPTIQSSGQTPSTTTTQPTTQDPTSSSTQLTMLSITDGTVSIMRGGTGSWIEAQVGMSLNPTDVIKTEDNSGAVITFFEGTTIELQAGTQIAINTLDFVEDTGSFTINLTQEIGKTISRVTKLTDAASSYQIESTAGIAAVLGSTMIVEINVNGVTWVSNLHGSISATGQGVILQIPEGMTGKIVPGDPPVLVDHDKDNSDDGGNSNT